MYPSNTNQCLPRPPLMHTHTHTQYTQSLPPSLGIANWMFIDSRKSKGGFNNHIHSQDCISLPPIDSPFPSHKPLELEEDTTQL